MGYDILMCAPSWDTKAEEQDEATWTGLFSSHGTCMLAHKHMHRCSLFSEVFLLILFVEDSVHRLVGSFQDGRLRTENPVPLCPNPRLPKEVTWSD